MSAQLSDLHPTLRELIELSAKRKWISYEISEAWNAGKGVVGVYVHNLKNLAGNQSTKGGNPLSHVTSDGSKLSSIAKAYDPPYSTSTNVFSHISDHLADWVEEAITIRSEY